MQVNHERLEQREFETREARWLTRGKKAQAEPEPPTKGLSRAKFDEEMAKLDILEQSIGRCIVLGLVDTSPTVREDLKLQAFIDSNRARLKMRLIGGGKAAGDKLWAKNHPQLVENVTKFRANSPAFVDGEYRSLPGARPSPIEPNRSKVVPLPRSAGLTQREYGFAKVIAKELRRDIVK